MDELIKEITKILHEGTHWSKREVEAGGSLLITPTHKTRPEAIVRALQPLPGIQIERLRWGIRVRQAA